jgi:hypothetical protein
MSLIAELRMFGYERFPATISVEPILNPTHTLTACSNNYYAPVFYVDNYISVFYISKKLASTVERRSFKLPINQRNVSDE